MGKSPVANDNLFSTKAPQQVTPGTTTLQGQHINNKGRVEPWKASYDQHGRLKARTDYNAGNKKEGIPDTHHHVYDYGSGGRIKQDHLQGEYEK